MSEQPPFLREIDTLIRARYPLLYLVTFEEQRVDSLLGEVARAHGKELVEWSATRGLRVFTGALRGEPIENTTDPVAALVYVQRLAKPSIALLKDFHRYLEDPLVVRTLRELGNALKSAFAPFDERLRLINEVVKPGYARLRADQSRVVPTS